jgi:hypothetical protein
VLLTDDSLAGSSGTADVGGDHFNPRMTQFVRDGLPRCAIGALIGDSPAGDNRCG